MAARAIWKGVLELGSHKVPVKLYSAVEERGVHFRLLEEHSHTTVHQQLVDPSTDEVVPYAEVQKGFAIDQSFVILKEEELEVLAPKASREIEITHFLSTQKLGPEWHVRPYYLGPDGDQASYFALAQALAAEDKEGVAHWVMRNQEYDGVLRENDGYLMLITLRHADEVIKESELPRPEGRAHTDKELAMAEQLIAAYADEFDPAQYKDEYRERVLSFVEAKAKGKKPRLKKAVTKHEEHDLSSALAKSLAGLKKAAPRKAAGAEQKPEARPRAREPRKEKHVA